MIFFNKLKSIKKHYGPKLSYWEYPNLPETKLLNIYLSWRWGYNVWQFGWNPLKRIERDVRYSYRGRIFNYKKMKYEN